MSYASLPSIPSLYGTAEVCSTESEATKSVSGKASPKDGSVSDYITAPVCKSELPSPFATAEICPAEVLTQVSPEKLVIPREFKLLSRWNKSLHNPLKSLSAPLKTPSIVPLFVFVFPSPVQSLVRH